ncbi:MAG: LacI family DNA-binding transcriptional regulator [Clostridiaceae bacterium]|nr:LacI family DNA-binding transcriptional regulator [Clostridiaceae bacterium]
MRVTIKDVAKKCGVSTTTVSLVLNQRQSRISNDTRDLVLKTAQEMNYRPNQVAVGLVTKKSNVIGLIIPDVLENYFSSICKGVETECNKSDYSVILGNAGESHSRDIDYMHLFIDHGVDGLIIIRAARTTHEENKEFVDFVKSANIPIVMVDRTLNEANCKTLVFDYFESAYLATKHLLDRGHRIIGCVTGPSDYKSTNLRLKGYNKALSEFGISFDQNLIHEGDYHKMESGSMAFSYLLGNDVTAVIAFNSIMALGVYKCAHIYKKKIPEDISVISLDDIFVADVLDVPMTTVFQPSEEVGRRAVVELISIINGTNDDLSQIVFKPKLKIRASTNNLPLL